MKQTFLLFIALFLVSIPGFASESLFNDADEQLVAKVGQTAYRIIAINGPSDISELPTMSNDKDQLKVSTSSCLIKNKFTAAIEGEDHQMFSVKVVQTDQTACTLLITYHPTGDGTHPATLVVYSSNSNEPVASIKLMGSTKDEDRLTTHTSGNNITEQWNGVELVDSFVLPNGFNPTNPKESDDFISGVDGGLLFDIFVWLIDHCPEFYFNTSNLAFSNVTTGTTKTGSFQVWAVNTKYHNNIKVNLEDKNNVFSINKTKINGQNIDINIGGSRETINVTYKPKAAGTHSAKVTLKGWAFSIYFYISGWVKFSGTAVAPKYTTSVSSLAFGNVVKGKTATKTFTVTGNLNSNLTLKSSNSYFTLSTTTITPAQAAAGKTVTVTYKPTATGSHSGTITISGGGAASKTISVSGKCVVPTINTSVSSLAFGNVVKGNSAKKTFIVTGTDLTGSLTVSSNNSNFTVSPTTITAASAANGATVTVTYKPSAAGSHSGTITISGGGAASKTVSVTGKCVLPTSLITTSVSSLAFGNVVKGNSAKKTFIVTGTDLTGSLTVSSNNSNFTVSPTTITAASAANGVTVTVTYKPSAAGSHSGTITISGGGAASKTVSVTGKCVVPSITVSSSSLHFGSNSSQTIKVTGTNLTGNLSLVVKGGNGVFTVTPTSITPSQAAAGATVTVKCNAASTLQRATATITISGGGASPKTVSLSYDKGGVEPMAGLIEPDGEDVNENSTNTQVFGNYATNVNELARDVKIYAEGQDIVIETPVEQSAIVSDIAGHARRVNLQAGRNVIPAGGNGVHIVRVGEKSAKLMLR